jgi:hypothetical protein
LFNERDSIESEIGYTLEWEMREEMKSSKITLVAEGMDPNDREKWAEQHAWMLDYLEKFKLAFANRIKRIMESYGSESEGIEEE